MANEKQCKACHKTKPLDEFYHHPLGRLKRGAKCKVCARREAREQYASDVEAQRARSKERYDANPGRERARMRRYFRENTEAFRARKRRWQETNPPYVGDPIKRAANQKVTDAVRSGRLVKPSACESCGRVATGHGLQGHHHDYSKPLEVEWLCTACHGKAHRKELSHAGPSNE